MGKNRGSELLRALNVLMDLNRQFQAASVDHSSTGRPAAAAPHIVYKDFDSTTGVYQFPEGAFRWYPLQLTAVCMGNILSAKFDCYLPAKAHPVLVSIPHTDLQKEIDILKHFEQESVPTWNLIQLKAAQNLGLMVPQGGMYGVPCQVVDSFFGPVDAFHQELANWRLLTPA